MFSRRSLGPLLALGFAALSALGASEMARAAVPEGVRRPGRKAPPPPPALPLRLDEAPELRLLQPFRDPKGPPATSYASYRSGPWAVWRERVWYPLDPERRPTESGSPESDVATVADAVTPRFELRDVTEDAWLARRRELPASFPFAGSGERGHWFVRHGAASSLLFAFDELSIAERWVPPWLRRLDPSLAGSLLEDAGCGRGGSCSPSSAFPGAAFVALWNALAPMPPAIPDWKCRERATTIRRYGAEHASFMLIRCDGSLADGALEKLSLLARPPLVEAPESLPDEPDPAAAPGEWVPGVRLVDPRLVWVLGRVGQIFPGKAIYVYSGYRPKKHVEPGEKGVRHGSLHASGRALDIAVEGVSNEELLAWCYRLVDTGCGYYPNSRFVHVDVRPRSSGNFVWIDASEPGHPSRYVAEWPGVVEDGRVVWKKAAWSDPYDDEYRP
ncbi:MAG: DUF882 domain-containing protein [Deltaproteobacteria bacterium]|nr:DUF882 domain-containing protein [Deltaproteobacteria bacterium]